MTDPNRRLKKWWETQHDLSYRWDDSDHPQGGTWEALIDLRLAGIPTLLFSALELLQENLFHLQQVLRTQNVDGTYLEDPGVYLFDKLNPFLRVLSGEVDVLGNVPIESISIGREKFADQDLSKFFNSLRKMIGVISFRLRKLSGITSTERQEALLELRSHLNRFIQRNLDRLSFFDSSDLKKIKRYKRKMNSISRQIGSEFRELKQSFHLRLNARNVDEIDAFRTLILDLRLKIGKLSAPDWEKIGKDMKKGLNEALDRMAGWLSKV
jgi:hypothetical protein